MPEQSLPSRPPLTRFVIGVPFRDEHLQHLRERFPTIKFVMPTEAAWLTELATADAITAWELEPEALAAAKNLHWFHCAAAGVEHLMRPDVFARDLILTNNSGVHAANIAEHLIAMMLAFARDLPNLVRAQLTHQWRDQEARDRVFELGGQTLLLVGLGDIALATAARARALGMRVTGVRRRLDQPVPPEIDTIGGIGDLPTMVSEADHIAICLPLTPASRGLISAAVLARMRPSTYLYNIGRGQVVDQPALIAALRDGRLAGAGLDVTDPEPLPADSPLWDMPNVLITAHSSGATPRYWDRALATLTENLARWQEQRPLLNVVDQFAGY